MSSVTSSTPLDKHSLPSGSYGYSAARMEDLGATEYTIVGLACDVSSSVAAFKPEMEASLKQIFESCHQSPRADNLLIRFIQFCEDLDETHGFKMLQQINANDYDDCLNVGGMTALRDASHNIISSVGDYAKQLVDNEIVTAVNGIIFIITDGLDNRSTYSENQVKEALSQSLKEEHLESLITILIGVGIETPHVSKALSDFKDLAGLTRYEEIKNATPATLAKLAQFVSQSISSQSSALGSGSASQPISLKV